ncbi:hypothetical protein CPBF424_33540 [Xanthomonas euroxanthea]|uniref:Uncharacterized protein n=1 Tax=Xanthomonas euroxanthea TaxID=2259622 RepID=A0AA46CAT3_9XANT|nr:hypothetical protein CPBF424_33540 [Xanthomonas euroxanthea]
MTDVAEGRTVIGSRVTQARDRSVLPRVRGFCVRRDMHRTGSNVAGRENRGHRQHAVDVWRWHDPLDAFPRNYASFSTAALLLGVSLSRRPVLPLASSSSNHSAPSGPCSTSRMRAPMS